MKRTRPTAIALAATLAAATPVPAYDLTPHQWRDRLLILVAPHADDAVLARQQAAVERHRDAVAERHLRVFVLRGEDGTLDGRTLGARDVATLRRQLDAAGDASELILIGKDGGIKRRGALSTPLDAVFAQIDGMPMRQTEMRQQRRGH